jgi:hypothetical protein
VPTVRKTLTVATTARENVRTRKEILQGGGGKNGTTAKETVAVVPRARYYADRTGFRIGGPIELGLDSRIGRCRNGAAVGRKLGDQVWRAERLDQRINVRDEAGEQIEHGLKAGGVGWLLGLAPKSEGVNGGVVGGDETVAEDLEALPLLLGDEVAGGGFGGLVLQGFVFGLGDGEHAVGVLFQVAAGGGEENEGQQSREGEGSCGREDGQPGSGLNSLAWFLFHRFKTAAVHGAPLRV